MTVRCGHDFEKRDGALQHDGVALHGEQGTVGGAAAEAGADCQERRRLSRQKQ